MGWDDVATQWYNSNDKDKVQSTSKERVEDKGNNVDVDDGHTYGHTYTCTWSDIYAAEVQSQKVTCNLNDEHYGLKAQIEVRLGVFVQPGRPKENV